MDRLNFCSPHLTSDLVAESVVSGAILCPTSLVFQRYPQKLAEIMKKAGRRLRDLASWLPVVSYSHDPLSLKRMVTGLAIIYSKH